MRIVFRSVTVRNHVAVRVECASRGVAEHQERPCWKFRAYARMQDLLGNWESRSYSGGDHCIHDAVERCQCVPGFWVTSIDNIFDALEPYPWCHCVSNFTKNQSLQVIPAFGCETNKRSSRNVEQERDKNKVKVAHEWVHLLCRRHNVK